MRLKKLMVAVLTVAMIAGSFSNPVEAAGLNAITKEKESTEEEVKEETEAVEEGSIYMEYPEDGLEVEEYVDATGARIAPYYNIKTNGGTWDGTYYKRNGKIMKDCFFCDGTYTFYLQSNGKPMMNKLTYHPDGKHLIYFDAKGHEVFDKFQYCSDVKYTCYFDTNGYLYKDKITFKGGDAYYLDGNGKMQQNGWFQFANGYDYGYAFSDGALNTEGFDYDPWGRVVYYHWNGMVARGLITDGNNYYDFDLSDGHYLGSFSAGNPNPVYGVGKYIVGVNIPAGEIIVTGSSTTSIYAAEIDLYDSNYNDVLYDFGNSQIVTLKNGQILYIEAGTATFNLGSRYVNVGATAFNAKIGVHLPAGVYRIQLRSGKTWGYVNLWNTRDGLNSSLVAVKEFNTAGSYVDVRVSNGQVLDVYNCTTTYIGQ